jgi:DNA-binding transcriptional MerR regulator
MADRATVPAMDPECDAEQAEQGVLFADSELSVGVSDQPDGYRGPVVSKIVGITYRQLDYWARTGLVVPTLRVARGSGSQRLYSFKDVLVLKVVKGLLDAGVSLQNIRVAVEHLRARGIEDLATVTLFSDGTTVYECGSADEIVDLLRGGQGVFGIAIGATMREITATIREFPAERAPVRPLSASPHRPGAVTTRGDLCQDFESSATA